MNWTTFFYLLGVLLAAWLLYQQVRNQRAAFSQQAFLRTASTLGLLALALIAFVGFCVLLLRA